MKKNLLLLLLFVSFHTDAQVFTNAQVYDFAAGDIYQVTRSDVHNPPMSSCSTTTYKTDSIVLKYYSPAMDTVFYIIHTEIYKPFVCPSFSTPFFNSYTSTVYYTNLTDTATHFEAFPQCMPISDTLYSSVSAGCNDVWRHESNTDGPTCFEEPWWSSHFVLGAGGPYVTLQDPHVAGQMYYEYLTYYRKGTSSCGTYYHAPGPMSVQESVKEHIQIFPNPASNVIVLTGVKENGSYLITDIAGRKIMQGELNVTGIDISRLEKGSYFVTVLSDKKESITKPFIRN